MSTRILIVDDNPSNLKLARYVLEMAKYDIEVAEDAEKAILIIDKMPFDLILMDIQLPGMDGLTLTRKLKSEKRTTNIPVVAMTAYAMKGDDKKAYDAGCAGYIPKPIDTRKFPEQIESFLHAAPAIS